MKIAYIISLFPCWSETFIMRELAELSRRGHPAQIYSLKTASEKTVHSEAEQLLSGVCYPNLTASLASTLRVLVQQPSTVMRIVLDLIAGGYRYPLMLAKTLAMLPVIFAYAESLKSKGIEHIHAHWATYPATAAWIIMRLTGISYSFTAHAHDIWLQKPYLKAKIDAASTVVTISQYNVTYLTNLYGAAVREKIAVVHCGLDPEKFVAIERDGRKTSHIVSVGRFDEIKGFEYLVRACRILKKKSLPFHCTFIGSGPLLRPMQILAMELDVDDRITFAGALLQSDLKQLLRQSDLFVLPSVQTVTGDQDGIPVALMEAMLMRLPVISTTVSGIPELILHRQTGLTVPPRDAGVLADAIQEMLTDHKLRSTCTENGHKHVSEQFNIELSVRQLLHIFGSGASLER
ncbi:MAG: glycosyltransferase family 4 protein [Candidatus Marinimicrobia bacterium]|nr:glycosyltransferase family 4 protein [Candidatus Neomarinimicrobiota bacterium]